jgi:hypothetical protein
VTISEHHLGPLDERADLLLADLPEGRTTRWLRPDLELGIGQPWFEVEVAPTDPPAATPAAEGGTGPAGDGGAVRDGGAAGDGGAAAHQDGSVPEVRILVRALGLLRDLCLLAEIEVPDAVVDTQLLTLLPGETATFRVTGPGVREVPVERWRELLWSEGRLRSGR